MVNKQIAVAMAVAMAVFLTAACIGASAEDTDASGPYEFNVDYDGYSISFYASEQASEGLNRTAYITNVTIDEGSTDVELKLPETVKRSDVGYEGTYNVTGIGTKGYSMVVFSTEDGAAKIKSITMPDTYTWLTSSAFSNCSNLESVKLSTSLKSIGEQTFSGTKISSIEIPESVETIEYRAFYGCADLDEVTIPSSVTSIGEDAFRYTGLTSVEIESADQSIERSIGKGAFAANSSLETISIPEGFTKISDNAFQNCSSITKVTIPSTVNEMWSSVFEGCSSLETISFEGDTVFKGSSIFNKCSSLKSVDLHEGMSGYTILQFSGCTSLEEVVIPEGFTKIDRSMFNGCTSLTDVTIPASATSVEDEAFNGCTSLKTVTFTGTNPPNIHSGTFGTNVEFIVPEGSEGVYQTALDTATGGTASINDYVAKVGEEKFFTIQAAIDSIATSGTVTILKETTVETTISISTDKHITLDFGGFSIDGSTLNGFVIDNDGILLIIGNGTIKANSEIKSSTGAVNNDGTLTLDGVSILNGYYAVQNVGSTIIEDANVSGSKFGVSNRLSLSNLLIENGDFVCTLGAVQDAQKGAIEIKDGKFEATGGAAVTTSGKLTIWDGTFEGSTYAVSTQYNSVKDSVKILGGTFTGTNGAVNSTGSAKGSIGITGGSFSSDVSNLCTDGYAPTQDGDSWVVKIDDESKLVAEIDGKGFTSLAGAIGMAGNGDIITLLKGTTESITVVSGKDIILDLGIYKLTNTDGYHTITVESGATLTIQGTGAVDNVSHQKAAVFNEEGGTVILAGGSYTRSQEAGSTSSDSGNNSYYNILNQGIMTIKAGVTVSQNGVYSSLIDNGWYDTSGMTGDHEAKLTIEGGTFTGGKYTIKNDEYGTVEIKYGTFTNTAQALVMNCNEMTISGGTFDGNGSKYLLVNFQYSDETSTGNLQIDGGNFEGKNGITDAGYSGKATITISKGNFEVVGAMFNFTESEPDVAVSGGTFNKTFDSKYMAPGFILEGNDEDGYGVVVSVSVTFDLPGDTSDKTVEIPKGTTIPSDMIPAAPEGYGYEWSVDDAAWNSTSVIEANITVKGTLCIVDITVSLSVDGGYVKATVKCGVTIDDSRTTYMWAHMAYDGAEPVTGQGSVSYELVGPGLYGVLVTVYDSAGVSGTAEAVLTYSTPDTPETSYDIEHDGDSATVTVPGDTVIITSSGEHDDIDITLGFTGTADIEINGNVGSGAVTVTAKPMTEDRIELALADLISEETVTDDIRGVDITVSNVDDGYGMWIKVKMGDIIGDDNGKFVASAMAYYIDEDDIREPVDCYVQGDEVWIYTDHNTEYVVIPTGYSSDKVFEELPSEEPDQPVTVPDDDELPPFIPAQPEDDDSVTIVACAAAAVVAALMAVFLILTYRKD